jgi:hypothetical protein
MKIVPTTPGAKPVTLQDVTERLRGDGSRRRDMRSAVTSFAKLVGRAPSETPRVDSAGSRGGDFLDS